MSKNKEINLSKIKNKQNKGLRIYLLNLMINK